METPLLRVFQSQVLLQCYFLLRAAKDVEETIKITQDWDAQVEARRKKIEEWSRNMWQDFSPEQAMIDGVRSAMQTNGMVFFAIQNLLNAAANISKALWGSRGSKVAERKPLRDSIGIGDDSPLRDTNMRNNFEHYDDRIDAWWTTSEKRNHIDLGIGSSTAIEAPEVNDPKVSDIFRLYEPQTTDVIFWGQRFNLRALVDEVIRILPVLEIETVKPRWTPEAPPG